MKNADCLDGWSVFGLSPIDREVLASANDLLLKSRNTELLDYALETKALRNQQVAMATEP